MLDTAALEENGHFPDILRQIAFMLLTIKQRLIKVVSAFMTCILKERIFDLFIYLSVLLQCRKKFSCLHVP